MASRIWWNPWRVERYTLISPLSVDEARAHLRARLYSFLRDNRETALVAGRVGKRRLFLIARMPWERNHEKLATFNSSFRLVGTGTIVPNEEQGSIIRLKVAIVIFARLFLLIMIGFFVFLNIFSFFISSPSTMTPLLFHLLAFGVTVIFASFNYAIYFYSRRVFRHELDELLGSLQQILAATIN